MTGTPKITGLKKTDGCTEDPEAGNPEPMGQPPGCEGPGPVLASCSPIPVAWLLPRGPRMVLPLQPSYLSLEVRPTWQVTLRWPELGRAAPSPCERRKVSPVTLGLCENTLG